MATQKKLLIETPRWGNIGHLFLVPSGGLSEMECLELQWHYYKQPCGSDYISVSADVKQRLDNGTVRDGTEFVVLTGIDAYRCSNVAAVQDVLRGMFSRVDGLIATHAKNHFGRSIVIELAELDTWLQHPVLNAVPNATFDGGSQKMNKGKTARSANTDLPFFRRYWIWLLGLCLLSIIGVGFIAFEFFRNSSGGNGNSSGGNVGGQNNSEIERLAKSINCATIDVQNDLKGCGFDDADLNDISSQLVSRSGYGKYFAVDNTEFAQFSGIENNLKILIGKDVKSESEGIKEIKEKLKHIKDSIININNFSNNSLGVIKRTLDDDNVNDNNRQPFKFVDVIKRQKINFNGKNILANCFLSLDDLKLLSIVGNLTFSELGADKSADFVSKLEKLRKVNPPIGDNDDDAAVVLKCYLDLRKALLLGIDN
jgi:hypothetical protein